MGKDKFHIVYALLDNASTATMCTKALVERLQIKPKKQIEITINTISGKKAMKGDVVDMETQAYDEKKRLPVKNVIAVDQLPISKAHVISANQVKKWSHLQKLNLKEQESKNVEILIGQNNAHLLKPLKIAGGGEFEPYGVLTPLGWTVYGIIPEDLTAQQQVNMIDSDEQILNSLERFWQVESMPQACPFTENEMKVLKLWEDNMYFQDGQIHLPIPFKSELPHFPDNFSFALNRLKWLGKKLQKNPQKQQQYKEAMDKNFREGYAEVVTEEMMSRSIVGSWWYITHHDVEHPRKPGVSRPVFNTPVEFKGVSLAKEVLPGPDLNAKMTDVLVKFREFEFVITGDIDSMFNRVKVPEGHRDYLRFLYWEDGDPTKKVIVCRMLTHCFGAPWSGSAATFAVLKTAELFGTPEMQDAVVSLTKNFYVDDWLKSVNSISRGIKITKDIRAILEKGGFQLSKFSGNERKILATIEKEKRAKELAKIDINKDKLPKAVTLGLGYSSQDDLLIFSSTIKMKEITRRGIMSAVGSLFDPLGLISPFIVPAKCIMQDICKEKKSWDEELPESLRAQWQRWQEDLTHIENLKIPRWLGCHGTETAQIHTFSDAAERAYGAVSYLCIKNDAGEITSSIILMSKSRIAPSKVQSMPRLELCAALMAVQLEHAVRKFLTVKLESSTFWTDSVLVLRYIRGDPCTFKTFTANRVAEIQRGTQVEQWRFVNTAANPADLISRGVRAKDLAESEMWITGPKYLQENATCWPTQPSLDNVELPAGEIKLVKAVYATETTTSEPLKIIEFINRFSNWHRLVRATAWLIRFCKYVAKIQCVNEDVTTEEVGIATIRIVKATQRFYIPKKTRNDKSFSKLFPIDSDGVLRVGGRLQYTNLTFEQKHPIIVPQSSHVAKLIIRHFHQKIGHSAVDRTLFETRTKFWIIGGRRLARKLLKDCIECKKMKASPCQQLMAPLPPDRARSHSPPFTATGLDYCGPIMVKQGRSIIRRYICVFVCQTSRAIHIEPAQDLTTSAFLNALERFVARRGIPEVIRSDNGTNFVGARNEINNIAKMSSDRKLKVYLVEKGIKWILNPPAASHQGGTWERMIRTMRQLKMAMLKGQVLTDEKLNTLACVIESTMNSRPLTRIDDDPQSMSPLTPSHLLKMNAGRTLFPEEFSAQQLRQSWKQVQYLAKEFWDKWSKQYMHELQVRSKWLKVQPNLKTGELVLMIKDQLPRMEWPLAVVAEVLPGRDGLVRTVVVRTAEGKYLRPITKLVRLEADIVDE